MTATMLRYGETLGPDASLFFIVIGLVYGLFGWRLIRYLAVVDAIAVGVLAAVMLHDAYGDGQYGILIKFIGGALVIALPLLAWRVPRGAVMAMGGGVGFFVVQLVLNQADTPDLTRWLLGLVGAGFAMAVHLTLHRQSAAVVTGIHGGWLVMAGMVLASQGGGGVGSNVLTLLGNHYSVSLATVAVFSTIMIAIQLSDLQKAPDPS